MSALYDVIVVGGGAAGMMAAGRAGELGKSALLIEKNKKLGVKLSITGGKRCNILNAETDERALLSHYGKSENFLYSPFSRFGMQAAYEFFESRGLPLKVEARKRAFPITENAADVVRTLTAYLKEGNVDVLLNTVVEAVRADGHRIIGIVAGGKEYTALSYILATGGVSHPETGSTGDGFGWLSSLNLPVHEPTPTIVPLKVDDAWVHRLSGVTIPDMKIVFFCNGVRAFSERGAILCTHFGLSGPLILNAAGRVADLLQEGMVTAEIDIAPDLDLGIFEKKITGVFDEHKNKSLRNALKEIVPAGTSAALLEVMPGIDPEKKVHSITKEERRILAKGLKALPVTIEGLMGFDRAVVADGGLPLTEVDTKTMRTLKYENLFVTGDLLHISRPSGGYSLQIAWTTGYVAGSNA